MADRLALRPREAAAALGLSESTLRRLTPQLPHVRLDGVLLYPVEGLRTWLSERSRQGAEQDAPRPAGAADADRLAREMLDDLGR